MVWSLVHSEDEIQATQSPFNANWDLIHCKPSTDPKSILHQSNANGVSKWGHSKLDNPVQQQFSNQPILANPCQSANPVPIQCQSANPRPIGQSQANPMPLLRAIPALNQGTSPLWRLVSSPLGGRIQDNRAFPILTNPIQCWPTHANAGQSGANPWLIRVHLHS